MSYRGDRGNHRGYRGGYHNYNNRGGYGGHRGHRGRGGYSNYNSYSNYMPQHNRGQMHGLGNMPPVPGGAGVIIPPEMIAELQKKLREKFPDADIPFMKEGHIPNTPLQLPVSNMRFKPPIHLVPNSSGYYGEANKKKTKKNEEGKEKEEEETPAKEPEILFNPASADEKVVSTHEVEHFKSLEKGESQPPSSFSANTANSQVSPDQIKQIYVDIFAKLKQNLQEKKNKTLANIQKRVEENIATVRAEIHHTKKV